MNYLVLQVKQFDHLSENKEYDWKLNQIKCRKVDPHLELGYQHEDKIFLIGKDKTLKHYPKCEEDLYDFDLKVKTPGNNPIFEYSGYAMETGQLVGNGKYLVSGGRDGQVYIRELGQLDRMEKVQVQSVNKGGVSAVSINEDSSVLTVGGYDGSIVVLGLNKGYEYENNTTLKTSEL